MHAIASLHLLAYYLMEGGTGAWQAQLVRAGDWLVQSKLCNVGEEAPRQTLALMDEAEQLAAKMIIVSGSPFSLFLPCFFFASSARQRP